MKESWVLRNKSGKFGHICEKFGVSMLISRLLVNRDICEDSEIEEFLHPTLNVFENYKKFKDINKAVAIITKTIDNGGKIRIVGDYDVDGVVSTYVLITALETLGAFVSYKIPDRITDGYGINRSIINSAINDGIDLIITCDNGIAAYEQIEYAKENGINVIVTDHHDIPERIPPADCVINPKQNECEYPEKGICGAFVAANLCEALFEKYGFGDFISENLDVLALATVCDVMELKGVNRTIVKYGLEKINRHENPGLEALIKENGLEGKKIDVYHLGFVIGPCINATGRLETADEGVKLLMSKSIGEASEPAGHLKNLNGERKEKTLVGLERAKEIIEDGNMLDDYVLVVYLPNCHESLAGIIAGRIRETYNRPAIVFTDSMNDSEMLKGSGRSTEEYNMFEKLSEQKKYLVKFGGHPMAAGMSIERSSLNDFRKELNAATEQKVSEIEKKVVIDISAAMSLFTYELTEEMSLLEPMGNGNEKPVFADKNVKIRKLSRFGKEGQYLTLEIIDSSGADVRAKMFNGAENFVEDMIESYGREKTESLFKGNEEVCLSITYYPVINEYNGRSYVQFMVKDYLLPKKKERRVEKKEKKSGAKQALIFCGGECDEINMTEAKTLLKMSEDVIVVGADSGADSLMKNEILPDVLIGDFDSVSQKTLDGWNNIKRIELPVDKDDTDTAFAIKYLVDEGVGTIHLFGALGGKRRDHSFANISLLAYCARRGIRCFIHDKLTYMTAISNGKVLLSGSGSGTVSVFAYGGAARGVTITGLKFETDDITLMPDISLGISNSFTGKDALIEVKEGTLIIMTEENQDDLFRIIS